MSDNLAQASRHLSFMRGRERWKPVEIVFWLGLVTLESSHLDMPRSSASGPILPV